MATRKRPAGPAQPVQPRIFIRLGKKLIAALAEITEGRLHLPGRHGLRPNGNSGPLAASLGMVEQYLIVQGREWERYAWVKARAVTARAEDIAALDAIVRPFVFRRYLDFRRDRRHPQYARPDPRRGQPPGAAAPDRSNNVKLGRGGIREIEFLAQVFQLIRGGRDAALRDRSTRTTLRIIGGQGLLSHAIVYQLLASYTFLRNLEHRLQYLDDAQTHTLPASEADRQTVAQMMGLPTRPPCWPSWKRTASSSPASSTKCSPTRAGSAPKPTRASTRRRRTTAPIPTTAKPWWRACRAGFRRCRPPRA
jgi:glutamate-ammonia-ligase adenylyltransferase